ncbi:MAG: hypothetical protein C7B45_03555 [Sulfobacillus acidophilus]|uniref:Uncharacterized protein n=1 Tax=Sulfobacillus acidophilus TaxID=53633 RepID=A0A2T2WMG8_9FIRM|nr:MAG: hypothetical protein C7B45_03555 [Sulfobacillus acidophilus]
MSGYTDLNFPLFHRVAAAFRAHGVPILNPAEHAPADTAWEVAMAEDFVLLQDACGVILLPELYRGKITPRKVREELPLDLSEGQAENIEDFSVSKPNCMTCHQ